MGVQFLAPSPSPPTHTHTPPPLIPPYWSVEGLQLVEELKKNIDAGGVCFTQTSESETAGVNFVLEWGRPMTFEGPKEVVGQIKERGDHHWLRWVFSMLASRPSGTEFDSQLGQKNEVITTSPGIVEDKEMWMVSIEWVGVWWMDGWVDVWVDGWVDGWGLMMVMKRLTVDDRVDDDDDDDDVNDDDVPQTIVACFEGNSQNSEAQVSRDHGMRFYATRKEMTTTTMTTMTMTMMTTVLMMMITTATIANTPTGSNAGKEWNEK